MKKLFISVLMILFASLQADAAEYDITRLTNNSGMDIVYPFSPGETVVWYGHDGSDYEIFRYAEGIITQITQLSDLRRFVY